VAAGQVIQRGGPYKAQSLTVNTPTSEGDIKLFPSAVNIELQIYVIVGS
jgi:hypothetical protein